MSRILVLDIETVRDPSVWSPPDDQPDAFAPPHAWRPIVIGCVLFDDAPEGPRVVRVGALKVEASAPLDVAEPELLGRFSDFMATPTPPQQLVTWNGRRFDLPVLSLRSMRYGLPWPWYYQARDMRYRYSEEGHCDLADAMSDYGAAPSLSLDGAAKLIGLPGKFGDIDGAGVGEALAAGRLAEIARYCISDAVQTAALLLRWQHHTGRISLEACRRALGELLAAEASAEVASLIDRRVLLLEVWDQPAQVAEAQG